MKITRRVKKCLIYSYESNTITGKREEIHIGEYANKTKGKQKQTFDYGTKFTQISDPTMQANLGIITLSNAPDL